MRHSSSPLSFRGGHRPSPESKLYIYKQWLRVYMQSKRIKTNKDLFQSLDDPVALLDQLHIY